MFRGVRLDGGGGDVCLGAELLRSGVCQLYNLHGLVTRDHQTRTLLSQPSLESWSNVIFSLTGWLAPCVCAPSRRQLQTLRNIVILS